jgi:hypothetical protein
MVNGEWATVRGGAQEEADDTGDDDEGEDRGQSVGPGGQRDLTGRGEAAPEGGMKALEQPQRLGQTDGTDPLIHGGAHQVPAERIAVQPPVAQPPGRCQQEADAVGQGEMSERGGQRDRAQSGGRARAAHSRLAGRTSTAAQPPRAAYGQRGQRPERQRADLGQQPQPQRHPQQRRSPPAQTARDGHGAEQHRQCAQRAGRVVVVGRAADEQKAGQTSQEGRGDQAHGRSAREDLSAQPPGGPHGHCAQGH